MRFKLLIGLLAGLILLTNISGCSFVSPKLHKKGGSFVPANINLPNDYNKFKDAVSYNVNVQISTNDVMSKMTKYRNQISEEFQEATIESYNVSESSGDLRLTIPPSDADNLSKIFSNDTDVTQFNKNMNQVGTSYVEAAQMYIAYKALLDGFDEVCEIAQKRSKYPLDEARLKRIFEDQVRSYESSLREYAKQMNKTSVQIYISKKSPDQSR